MSYGLETYFPNGVISFEMSDRLLQIVYIFTPQDGSSGTVYMPNVTNVAGMIPINIPSEAVTNGGQGFTIHLSNPNILTYYARPYGGIVKPSKATVIVVSSNA